VPHHGSPSGSSSGSAALSSNSWLYGEAKNPSSSPTPSRLSTSSTTEVQCSVENVYPKPELTIYLINRNGASPRTLQNARYETNSTRKPDGTFIARVTMIVEDSELLKNSPQETSGHVKYHPATVLKKGGPHRDIANREAHFECLVSQDEIKYEIKNRTFLPLRGK